VIDRMLSLGELAQIVGAHLVGDPGAVVGRAQRFEAAGEGDITLAIGAAYRDRINQSNATAIIIEPPAENWSRNVLVSKHPKLAFARAIQCLHARVYTPRGISEDLVIGSGSTLGASLSVLPRVTIGRDTAIGDRVTLHPGVVIGDRCRIGDDAVIFPNVSIYDDCEIGSRVTIHAGSVIGSDGFGFVPDEEGRQVRMLQLGRVVIGDDSEVGANCAIDRGGFGDTVLGRGVKLDNLVHIGHQCNIGEDTVIAALSGFSGGVLLGRGCVIAGQVGFVSHISIGDNTTITAKTAVTKSHPARSFLGGMMPAQDHNSWRRRQVQYFKLPEIAERLKRLEKLVERDRKDNDAGE
jgi:UDP-3-O-[3-hydroxymyristoyl] glucosamine N-acyltransferase